MMGGIEFARAKRRRCGEAKEGWSGLTGEEGGF